MNQDQPELFSVASNANRWSVSQYTIRRLVKDGSLRAVYIAGRLMIPRTEIERAELTGVGLRKKRGPKPKAEVTT